MPKFVQGRDGKFAGSIGSGKERVPTAVPGTPAPAPRHDPPGMPDFAPTYDAYQRSAAVNVVLSQVASRLGLSEPRIRHMFNEWRQSGPDDFEDKPAPEERFRYDLNPDVPTDPATQRALRKLGYEHYLATPYPVFVYGTLRSGQGNERLMSEAKQQTLDARMPGVALYTSEYVFPYAAEHDDPETSAVGEVVWLTEDERGESARQMLDHLEGFYSDYPSSSHYERTTRTVTYADPETGEEQQTTAWVYLARGRSRAVLREADRIPSGDWVAWRSIYDGPPAPTSRF